MLEDGWSRSHAVAEGRETGFGIRLLGFRVFVFFFFFGGGGGGWSGF